MNHTPAILGGLDVETFLREYWQKKPLLIRQAIPAFEAPLDPDELAGLACEDGVEARLIERRGENYTLENGPFDPRRFAQLGARDWTLLVQDIDKHIPDMAEWLDRFDFIPRWRVDDLMISCAATGGGVGPHTDAYDVFLLQARGRRRWSIAQTFDQAIVPGLDVRVLKNFTAEQEWTLEPGDMLYLPPNVAHDGVALDDDCMTWSIGFRAPSLRDMHSDFCEWLHERIPEDRMYADADLAREEAHDGAISPQALARMRSLMRAALQAEDAELDRWFGCFMTEPKPWLRSEASEETPPPDEFRARLATGDALLRDTRAQLAWVRRDDGAWLFVNGEAWDIAPGNERLLAALCSERRWDPTLLALADEGLALLRRLHAEGVLHFAATVEANDE